MNSRYHQVHYGVFHMALPVALKEHSFEDFKESVLANQGNDFILGIWNRYKALNSDQLNANETEVLISRTDIHVSVDESFSEGHLYLIKTPQTQEPLEAAYIAVGVAHGKHSNSLRYFTCEMPMQEGSGWVIGEVHGLGRRSNHGTIQQLSFDAFKNTVLLILGWDPTESTVTSKTATASESVNLEQPKPASGPLVPVPAQLRQGKVRHFGPDYFPDLANGQFAASGMRGPIRFVSNGKSVGLYSTQLGLRSKFINRGAIIKIDNERIRYFASGLSERIPVDNSEVEKRHGPLLNFQAQVSSSGEQSVTASMEETHPVSRNAIDQMIYNSTTDLKPTFLPFFWNYRHRFASWLAKSTFPIFYELSGATKDAYQALIDAGDVLGTKGGCFFDRGERFVDQSLTRKGGAGVTSLIDTEPMLVGTFPSKYFHMNFQPLTFVMGQSFLHFLPEELVLVSSEGQSWFLPYSGLSYRKKTGIRLGIPAPTWAQPVGYVWQYMNKDGSPDRRYNNNAQIPQYQAWELDFSLGQGITIDTAFLDQNSLDRFITALDRLIVLSMSRMTPQL